MDRGLAITLSCSILLVALYPSFFAAVFSSVFSQQLSWESTASAHALHSTASDQRLRTPDLFYHLGGNGPWIPKVNGSVEGGTETPDGCRITQVHMVRSLEQRLRSGGGETNGYGV